MIYWRHTYYKMHSLKKWVHQLLLISDLIIWLLLDYFLWKPCTTPAFDVIFEKSASSFTIPAWWPYKWVKLKIVANSFLAELRKVFFSFSFLVIFLFHSPTSSRFSSTNHPQCLKISQKVAFNITSEASYVYILSGLKCPKWSILASIWKPETRC